jgi:hypothetical protein
MWHNFACTHHQSLDQTEKELKYLTTIMYILTHVQRCRELTTIIPKMGTVAFSKSLVKLANSSC